MDCDLWMWKLFNSIKIENERHTQNNKLNKQLMFGELKTWLQQNYRVGEIGKIGDLLNILRVT
jgi:hypothetical protein